ncbi:MAG: DUF1614 domain-containing protein [Methanomicrobiaceae archaeon]|nr:DUF1614 domain-containing protein [Methanomicrobiaceae archaeon]
MARYFFSPFSVILLIFIVIVLILLLPLLFLGIIGAALFKLGFGIWQVILLVIAMVIGSFVNIPITKVKSEQDFVRVPHGRLQNSLYRVQEFSTETTIAANLGGCIIPVLISGYLLYQAFFIMEMQIMFSVLAGVLIVALITNRTSKPMPGVGITTPFFIPPLCALICGIIFSGGILYAAPVIAYVSGTIGTLIGADLLNLKRMGSLGVSVASIGGAGTFDGIFLSGIIAAFLL